MEKLTYQQAYDKIIQAYFRDEIKILDSNFCFCGTLNNNKNTWAYNFKEDDHSYSWCEYGRMERALFSVWPTYNWLNNGKGCGGPLMDKKDEEKLFAGMCAAIEVLKQIHKERGEDVDGVQEFTKRELVKQI